MFVKSVKTCWEILVNVQSAEMSFVKSVLKDGNDKAIILQHSNLYVLYDAKASNSWKYQYLLRISLKIYFSCDAETKKMAAPTSRTMVKLLSMSASVSMSWFSVWTQVVKSG